MYPIATTLHTPHAPAHLLWFQANINLLSVSTDLLRLALSFAMMGPEQLIYSHYQAKIIRRPADASHSG